MSEKISEKFETQNVDWQKFSKAIDTFLLIMESEIPKKDADILRRMSLSAEVEKDMASAAQLLESNKNNLRPLILKALTENKLPPEVGQEILKPFAENQILSEIFEQYGHGYKLGSTDKQTTDCVQVLRNSKTFDAMAHFFSDGADLILDENFGRVADVVDRENFTDLAKYKPTKDKMYVFALAKPPLFFNGKPNVTHLQIPNGLNTDPKELSVIHASSDKGYVSVEKDITKYLEGTAFERVYVIEIDLKKPYSENLYSRQPFFKHQDNLGNDYERPGIYDIPLIVDKFELIKPKKEVPIYPDEKRVLEIAADNRALEYLTVLTGMREGKIGNDTNNLEAVAFGIGYDTDGRSLGLHQVTKVVHPLFNTWLETLPRNKAVQLGEPFTEWWHIKQSGKDIPWSEMTKYLNTYDLTDQEYKNVAVSTICSYVLIKHLYEDQLMTAYKNYGETFFGIDEQPESIIAIGGGYRSDVDVLVTGSQQYRIAEMAYECGLIDADFKFTVEAKSSPMYTEFLEEWSKQAPKEWDTSPTALKKSATDAYNGVEPISYEDTFYPDGYRGLQTQYVAYMVYKKTYPEGQIKFTEFIKAYGNTKEYGSSQATMLSEDNAAVAIMHKIYRDKFGKKPHLLMTEDEFREVGTELHTSKIKFGNEGLWVLSHYEKLTKENWEAVSTKGKGREENPIIEKVLNEKLLETNEISKIPPEQGRRFYNIIENLPGHPWYAKYPEYIMSACFEEGLFLKEGKSTGDGKWIKETEDFINRIYVKNLTELQKRLAHWNIKDPKVFIELATASSQMSIDDIVYQIENVTISPLNFLEEMSQKGLIRLGTYRLSFDRLMQRFKTKNPIYLEKKEELSEKEQRAAFAIKIFEIARSEALERGLTLDFAIVATSQACVESAWGGKENEKKEQTLYAAGTNNIFSIKSNYEEYTEEDYLHQTGKEDYYIHHTKEYNEDLKELEWTYAAFKKFDSIEDSIKGYFDLIEKDRYYLALEIARSLPESQEENPENQEKIFEAIYQGGYSTDEEYVSKTLAVSKSVTKVLREYGLII